MATRKFANRNIRKITKVGGKSFSVTFPIEIVKKLEKILAKIEETRKLQQEQLQKLELLKQSILHQAFQGKL